MRYVLASSFTVPIFQRAATFHLKYISSQILHFTKLFAFQIDNPIFFIHPRHDDVSMGVVVSCSSLVDVALIKMDSHVQNFVPCGFFISHFPSLQVFRLLLTVCIFQNYHTLPHGRRTTRLGLSSHALFLLDEQLCQFIF